MKYFVVFFFILLSTHAIAQGLVSSQKVSGIIVSANTQIPLSNVNIINVNKMKGTTTDEKGLFDIEVTRKRHPKLIHFRVPIAKNKSNQRLDKK